MGAGQQREIQEAKWSGGQIHLRQTLNEEAIADEFSECQQVSCPPAKRRMNFPLLPCPHPLQISQPLTTPPNISSIPMYPK
ncbi:hypothetical protein F320042A7_15210 [Blautia producta]